MSGGYRNADIGGHRQFQAFIESVAVDDCDGRLREHGQRFHQARIDGVIEADAERGAGSRECEHAGRVVVLDVLEQFEQPDRHRGR